MATLYKPGIANLNFSEGVFLNFSLRRLFQKYPTQPSISVAWYKRIYH